MSRGYAYSSILLVLLAVSAGAQSVIATHAGLVHYFEGAVLLNGTPLESHLGRFDSVPQGAELRTEDGKAEVLLTPGVFLRMGDHSAIRMVSNDLADTKVELRAGSAIVDAGETNADTSVSLTYKNWRVHILGKGVYRIDTDPQRLAVLQGEAEVFSGTDPEPVAVDAGMTMPFAAVLVPEKAGETAANQEEKDGLSDWENGRSESIAADNAIAEQIDKDPATAVDGMDEGFTNFPLLDVPMLAGGFSDPYRSLGYYQSGFNSIYLPGYTYAPILLGLAGRGSGIYLPSPPLRLGGAVGGGIFYSPRPIPPATLRSPIMGPVHVGVGTVHGTVHGVVHAGHR